jgi:DHA1 family bicyclomycin/chloramphenicol resistance-like MFS transporter
MASIVIQGAMTLYLTTSEVIVGEVYDRDSWFPFVFGAIAVCLALTSLANGRLVTRLGLSLSIGLQSRMMASASAVLVAITVVFELPNFYLFHAALALTVSSYMMISPNLNAAGMVPMGDMAGTASSLISAARLGFGALIAALMTGVIGDSLSGFAIATAAFATAAAVIAAVSVPADLVES